MLKVDITVRRRQWSVNPSGRSCNLAVQ